jgi:hypothetical protein
MTTEHTLPCQSYSQATQHTTAELLCHATGEIFSTAAHAAAFIDFYSATAILQSPGRLAASRRNRAAASVLKQCLLNKAAKKPGRRPDLRKRILGRAAEAPATMRIFQSSAAQGPDSTGAYALLGEATGHTPQSSAAPATGFSGCCPCGLQPPLLYSAMT